MIRLGINPIGWTNDDVRWLGDDIPLEVCLAEARQAHMGTPVQRAADVERLFAQCGPSVGVLIDTGHLTYAGGDPATMIRKHAKRVRHVHCKDIRKGALIQALDRDLSFTEAIL